MIEILFEDGDDEPVMHDDNGVPIYYGDTYYDLDGWILSEKSLEKYRKECEYANEQIV